MNIYETDAGNVNIRGNPTFLTEDVAPEVHGKFLKTNLKKKQTEKESIS